MALMMAIQGKKTVALDLYKPLRQYISQQFSEREAQQADDDLRSVQQMRTAIEKSNDSLDARRDVLQAYYRALCAMETRFPISNEAEHINSVTFTWYDAFKQSRKASQQNIHFEKAAVMFNLGAVHSQIALTFDRASENGLKKMLHAFRAAAGAFAFLRDNVAMKASAPGTSTTVDISVECAGMLERLMLAQAQECYFEKVVADGKPSSMCVKIARQVGIFYEEAQAAMALPPLNQHFDRTWTAHIHLKAALFHAEALFRVSLELHEQDEIPVEIARLKTASAVLTEAKKWSRGAVQTVIDAVNKLDASVTRNLERAVRENDRVYLMPVPNPDTLPPLPAASLVTPIALNDVLDASKDRLFTNLVPDSCAKAVSRYTELLDDIIRVQAEKLQRESEITRVKLREMDLPESLHALDGNAELPEALRDDVEAVQVVGGPKGLEAEMGELRDLRRVTEEMLVQIDETLQREAREDSQYRAQFGGRWKRPSSVQLTDKLTARAAGYAKNLKDALESDRKIERSVRDNTPLMSILDAVPIQSALPSLGRPMLSLNGNEDQVVGGLRQKLMELDKLALQRAGLEDMLKDMKRQDNILPKLMATSGSYEDLFKKELARYDPVCAQVAKNVEAQERLMQQIKINNDAFAATFNLQDFQVVRERAYKQIAAAVKAYRDIRDSINEGMRFYVTLQEAISTLRQECSDYVLTRNIQSKDMVDDIQRQISGMSFSDRTYPSSQAPPPNAATERPPYQQYPQQQQQQQQQPLYPPPPSQPQPVPSTYSYPQSMPQPPYYSSQGHQQHQQQQLQQQQQQPLYGQPPYPGWQGPYYNSTASSNQPGSQGQNPPHYPFYK